MDTDTTRNLLHGVRTLFEILPFSSVTLCSHSTMSLTVESKNGVHFHEMRKDGGMAKTIVLCSERAVGSLIIELIILLVDQQE